ncbi:MAG: LytTR family DNA-binding domain-containing protein [Odoribacter sp.]|nr:LytTR family DNA-binding domain-containing protein [Odoribacter sp.]
MNCIIVDDEPLAREAVKLLIEEDNKLNLCDTFNNAADAGKYLTSNNIDLVFLDIRMPGITGQEFARTIPKHTLVIFTTAYAEYALDSYEVDAVDYLVKPIQADKFHKAVEKAEAYHALLMAAEKQQTLKADTDFFFVKSERRFVKINFKDILFIEALKDYVIIQLENQRVITKMTVKGILELLPPKNFIRINRSYIINTDKIEAVDTNDVYIGKYEIAIGSNYRDAFFEQLFPS